MMDSVNINDIIASPITQAGGTWQTSLRLYCASIISPVFMSTDGKGFARVAIGFIATFTTIGSPLVTPPSKPPA